MKKKLMTESKPNILFVGSFKKSKDGSTGGQNFACRSLVDSDLKKYYNFIKVDTTADTVPAPPIYRRIPKVIARLLTFIFYILFKKIDSVLIFSSAKLSFIEKGLMAVIARFLGKKVIFAPRSGLTLIDYERSKFMKGFIPFVIKHSTLVLCQGKSWKKFYQKISEENNEKFIVINNWIDPSPYLFQKINKIQLNELLTIVYVGWLEEYKGIKDLLEALKILSEKGVSYNCHIYGNGSQYKYSEDFINENNLNDSIKLMGWADKKLKLEALKMADIYVLPSHYEGFPNALLEAMASELAVIVTNITAIDDIIIDDYNGLISECNNPKSLASKIEILINENELRLKIAINSRNTVLEKFTIQSAIKKIEKIF